MNKAAWALGASTLILAASTLYLAREVSLERARLGFPASMGTSADATRPAVATSPPAAGIRSTREAGAEAGAVESTQTTAANQGPTLATPDVFSRLVDEEIEESARNSGLRRDLIEERIPMLRDQYLGLQRRLGVDHERWQRFMEVVAAQELGYLVAALDCKKERNCEQPDIGQDQHAREFQEIVDVLGPAHANAVARFRQSSLERFGMSQMQVELAEQARIPEPEAEKLIESLAQVRMDYENELAARDKRVGRFYTAGGALLYDQDLVTADERLEDAARYSRRLRSKAAEVLNGAPLAAFDRQQDRLLELLRESQDKQRGGS